MSTRLLGRLKTRARRVGRTVGVERLEPRCLLVSYLTIEPPGPLTKLVLGDDGSFQVERAGDAHGSVYPGGDTPGDSGFFVRPRGTYGAGPVVGMDLIGRRAQGWTSTAAYAGSVAWYPLYHQMDDDGLGALLIADNRLDNNPHGHAYQMVQHVRYEPGRNGFRVDVALVNLGAAPLVLDAFAAADLMVDDGDPTNDTAFANDNFGFGWYDTQTGGVGGVGFNGGDRFFVVSNPGLVTQPTGFSSGHFNMIWQAIGGGGHLDNRVLTRTIDPPTRNDLSFQNNGAALEWQGLAIAPGGSERVSYTWSFDGWAGGWTPAPPALSPELVQARAGETYQGRVARFGGTTQTAQVGDYLATVHWGDGAKTQTATVTRAANGTGFVVNGAHVFAAAGRYEVTITVIGPEGETGTVRTTADVSQPGGGVGGPPAGQVYVNGILDPGSDLGASNQDGITSYNLPLFWGYATIGANVTVTATNLATGAVATFSGTARASDSAWLAQPSSPLADGSYSVSLEARLPSGVGGGGQATVFSAARPMVIDTVAPQIIALDATPRIGRLVIGFLDDRSGLDHATMADARTYRLLQRMPGGGRSITLRAVHAPGNRIVLTAPGRLFPGVYNFTILADVRDLAGNALQGAFPGRFPTGDGRPGTSFLARLRMNNAGLTAIEPMA